MPPRFRSLKASLRSLLADPDWQCHLADLDQMPPEPLTNALLACLPQGGEMTHRAAVALGRAVPRLGRKRDESRLGHEPTAPDAVPSSADAPPTEEARVFMRRLMWHMNDESGNIGWGIPEAFGEILANHQGLAREFQHILFSYITATGHVDNYCDHTLLRQSCFAATARLLAARPDLSPTLRPVLVQSKDDPDPVCREWATTMLQKLRKY